MVLSIIATEICTAIGNCIMVLQQAVLKQQTAINVHDFLRTANKQNICWAPSAIPLHYQGIERYLCLLEQLLQQLQQNQASILASNSIHFSLLTSEVLTDEQRQTLVILIQEFFPTNTNISCHVPDNGNTNTCKEILSQFVQMNKTLLILVGLDSFISSKQIDNWIRTNNIKTQSDTENAAPGEASAAILISKQKSDVLFNTNSIASALPQTNHNDKHLVIHYHSNTENFIEAWHHLQQTQWKKEKNQRVINTINIEPVLGETGCVKPILSLALAYSLLTHNKATVITTTELRQHKQLYLQSIVKKTISCSASPA